MFRAAERTALHFSMPLDGLDRDNLALSGVRLVQLPWAHALLPMPGIQPAVTQLEWLTGRGYGVILRMGREDAAALGFSRERLRSTLGERLARTHGRGLDAVIVFNEPDLDETGKPYNLAKGSPDWHQEVARAHARETRLIVEAYADMVRLVAAPLTNRHQSEDDPGEPGLMEWGTELRTAYHLPGIKGVGCHIYEQFLGGDPASIDTGRLKHKLWLWSSLWQPPLVIDEFNVTHGGPVERARAWCAAIRWLQRSPQEVELFSPFVSNGTGKGYDPALIVREPAAYAELRTVVSPA